MKTIHPNQAGFSLVEVLVAIAILLMVIVGPLTMISRANNSTSFATEQINAWFLAQEGIELVQKQRDDMMLEWTKTGAGTPWSDFKSGVGASNFDACYTANGCGVSISNGSPATVQFVACTASGVPCRLKLSSSASVRPNYVHGGSDPDSLYTRKITIDETGGAGGNEVEVTSTVTWRTGTLIKGQSVTMKTYLLNVYNVWP